MSDKSLPHRILIVLAEHDYVRMQQEATMLKNLIEIKEAALPSVQFKLWHELERMSINHLERELSTLKQKTTELENILVEWNAPGWTST